MDKTVWCNSACNLQNCLAAMGVKAVEVEQGILPSARTPPDMQGSAGGGSVIDHSRLCTIHGMVWSTQLRG